MTWRMCHIGEFVDSGKADIQTGPFGTQLKASDYIHDGTPVINVRNIGYANLRQEKLEFVGEQITDRLSVHLLQENDIVFGRKGAVDRHLLVTCDQNNWMQGSDCIRLRFQTEEVLPSFISYAFLQNGHQQWMLTQSGNKATMASLNHDIIKRIPLMLPSCVVQGAIVKILVGYDDLIENNRRRMALLEESARLLYSEWFVRLRFPGYEHTSIVDGVPQGWERVLLEDALILQRGFDLPTQDRHDGNVPIYGSTGILGYHDKAKAVAPGIVTGRSGTLGEVQYVAEDYWPLNTSLWVKEFKRATPLFALFLLREMNLKQYNGGASVPTLDRKSVHRVEILIPTPLMLRSFDEFVTGIFDQIKNLSAQNQKLRAARDLLLPRLMSGELTA